MRYIEAANGSNAAPKTILELATAPASGAVTLRLIWDGQTAPTPSARDLSKNAGATVAGGMGKDGYIYAMRAIGTQEPGWDLQGGTWAGPNFEWRTHTRHYEMLRYGRDGVDNLGIVSGLGPYRMLSSNPADVPGAIDARLGAQESALHGTQCTGLWSRHLLPISPASYVADSWSRCLASASGVEPTTSAPMLSKRATTSGCFMVSTSTVFIFLTMAGGVEADMKTANHGETS